MNETTRNVRPVTTRLGNERAGELVHPAMQCASATSTSC